MEVKPLNVEELMQSFQNKDNNKTERNVSKDPLKWDKTEFLKLLIMQLKYQNPMNPVDNEGFVEQLSQLTALETSQNTYNLLKEMKDSFDNIESTFKNSAESLKQASVLNIIGKKAVVLGDRFSVEDTENPVEINFKFSEPNELPDRFRMEIYDNAGNLINYYTILSSTLKDGEGSFNWDLRDNNGILVPKGEYKVIFKDFDGNIINDGGILTEGSVDGVKFLKEGQVSLIINGNVYNFEDIEEIK